MALLNDKKINIATAGNRTSKHWQNSTLMWSRFCEKLKTPVRSSESLSEYLAFPKSRQDNLKDVGGFVGGSLQGERRKASAIIDRDLITLDMDNIPREGTGDIIKRVGSLGCAAAVYSTRKHSNYAPRVRVIIPLAQPVTADEYEPIARKAAELIGISFCDPTTFEVSRLMYWPSCSSDSEYVFEVFDKPFCDGKALLDKYEDWKDVTSWPQVPGIAQLEKKRLSKQEDPTQKRGLVGAFCRAYSITEAMERFVPGTYEETTTPGRYTYVVGTTTGGAIVYDGNLFLYSHHATDPCSGQLVNAFDLVRLHMFGDRDDKAKEGTPPAKMPSYLAMKELAAGDKVVTELLARERIEEANRAFGIGDAAIGSAEDEADHKTQPATQETPAEPIEGAYDWISKLTYDINGQIDKTIDNAVIIAENDPLLKGKIALDVFAGKGMATGALPWDDRKNVRPWTDTDTAQFARYLEKTYKIKGKILIDQALLITASEHKYNEVDAYLKNLKWDGVKRLDTVLIDYLGAEDNVYTRAVMHKTLCAAVYRAVEDCIKFDNMPILVGKQGIGKSTLLRYLGLDWFSDSLTTFDGKDAVEMIQGQWIVEVGELTALNRQETNAIKQFMSKADDVYRKPYGRITERLPRRCVFFGTSNETAFLRDQTGNRRFWPVDVGITEPTKSIWDDLPGEVDQIWAEAYMYYAIGEKLHISKEVEAMAEVIQRNHMEDSHLKGLIMDFLEKKVPATWNQMSVQDRRMFLSGNSNYEGKLIDMDRVCAAEIWAEVMNGDIKQLSQNPRLSREINTVLSYIPGWEKVSSTIRCGPYGVQKGFRKSVDRRQK